MSYNPNSGPAQWPSPNDPTNNQSNGQSSSQPNYYPPSGYTPSSSYAPPQPPPSYSYQQPYGYQPMPQPYGYPGGLATVQARVMTRFWAFLIDSILVGIITSIIFSPLAHFSMWHYAGGDSDNGTHLGTILQFIILGIYATIATVYFGGTIGKRIMGLKVVNADGSAPTLNTYILRYVVGYPISAVFMMLGFIWAFFNIQHQTWHDKIAHTYVVRA